jgi:hypothetical protein
MGTPRRTARSAPVVFAGRFDPDKGPDVFLDAVALLERGVPVTMARAGCLDPALRAQGARLGLEGRVTMPGWLADPAPVIAGAAVLVIPSRDESFSQLRLPPPAALPASRERHNYGSQPAYVPRVVHPSTPRIAHAAQDPRLHRHRGRPALVHRRCPGRQRPWLGTRQA